VVFSDIRSCQFDNGDTVSLNGWCGWVTIPPMTTDRRVPATSVFRIGKWRKARSDHPCDCGTARCPCVKTIRVGEMYFDTREGRDGPFSTTLKYHADCAR
jgi:hypothetical protein